VIPKILIRDTRVYMLLASIGNNKIFRVETIVNILYKTL